MIARLLPMQKSGYINVSRWTK